MMASHKEELRQKIQEQISKISSKVSIEALPEFAQAPAREVLDTVVPTVRNNFRPHVLRHRSLAAISFLMVAVKIATIAVLTFGPVLPALSSAITINNVVALTNKSRGDNGLGPLSLNAKLNAAAQEKANDMMARQYFSHISPDNRQPWDFIAAQGYAYQGAGENLGVGFFQAESLEDAWMNSPGHRANILNSSFKEIGVGISTGTFQGQQATVVVQMFGLPAAQPAQPAAPKVNPPAPKPAPQAVPRAAAPVAEAPKPAPQPVQVAAAPPTQAPAPEQPAPAVQPPAPAPTPTPAPAAAPVAAPEVPPAPPIPLAPSIPTADLQINKDIVQVTIETSAPADKVSAVYGNNQLEELKPNPNTHTLWQGEVPVSALTQGKYLNVKTEKAGTTPREERLAVFDSGFKANYDLNASPEPKLLNIFGMVINPEILQNQFYLLMIALLLSLMVVAIAVRAKVQHLDLISNTAFVVTLATLLWYSGIQM